MAIFGTTHDDEGYHRCKIEQSGGDCAADSTVFKPSKTAEDLQVENEEGKLDEPDTRTICHLHEQRYLHRIPLEGLMSGWIFRLVPPIASE